MVCVISLHGVFSKDLYVSMSVLCHVLSLCDVFVTCVICTVCNVLCNVCFPALC